MFTKTAPLLGIDLGGTSFRVGLLTPDLTLIDRISIPTRRLHGPEAVIRDMKQAVETIEHRNGVCVERVGLGSPGPLDLVRGSLCNLPNFPGWDGFPLRHAAEEAFKKEVLLENDANAAALAEAILGAGKGMPDASLCMLTLGTGVGCGVVLNGRIWHGSFGVAGELGHMCVEPEGETCPCGTRGCLEFYTSATGIARSAQRAGLKRPDGEPVSGEELAQLARHGNPLALRIFDHVGVCLGRALAAAANLLDVSVYVIGGGVAESWQLFMPALESTLCSLSYTYRLRKDLAQRGEAEAAAFVLPAECGPDAGLLGAALMTRRGDHHGSAARHHVAERALTR